MGEKIIDMILHMERVFQSVIPSLHPVDMLIGILASVITYLVIREKRMNARHFRKGEEYGSARWGNAKDIRPFMDPNPDQNIIFTETRRGDACKP